MSRRFGGVFVGLMVLAFGLVLMAGSGADAQSEPGQGAVPAAVCGPGSEPETAEQGRVPATDYTSGRVDRPYTCNTEVVGHHEGTGGFKVFRYVDSTGRECAFYDSNLVVGHDLLNQITTAQGPGVIVLDMSDPTNPVQVNNLVSPAMLSPHESLDLHEGRGLLVAAMGTAATLPGIVDVYDVSADCRNPRLLASTPFGLLGHESGFAPDGMTYYVSGMASPTIVAIDLTDPSLPTPIAILNRTSHGMNVSADGNRLYTTPLDVGSTLLPVNNPAMNSGLTILDVSSIQARELPLEIDIDLGVELPVLEDLSGVEVVSEFAYPGASIAQTAIPVTIDGAEYLVTIDEFVDFVDFLDPLNAQPGIGRLVDISDETNPEVVSTLELEVHQPDLRPTLAGDPGSSFGAHSYAGHYCSVPQRVQPGIVACSFILSGMRVFDISDPLAPREIAYFNAGRGNPSPANLDGAPYAMSAPAFVPERCEVWYTDVASGFWAVELTNGVWCPASSGDVVTTPLAPEGQDGAAPVAPRPALPATGSRVPLGVGVAVCAVAVIGLFSRRLRVRR